MVTKKIASMDLKQIDRSGQCFSWERLSPSIYRISCGNRCVTVEQRGEEFCFSCDEEDFQSVWFPYFDLGTDYDQIRASIDPADAYLTKAAACAREIRILRQDLWEVLVSFLISQNNNVGRIRNSVAFLRREYGAVGNDGLPLFPRPRDLADVTEEDFRAAGLGYRAGYLARLVDRANEDSSDGEQSGLLNRLRAADYEEASELLTSLRGVGKKVSDCVCLFGLHHVDAFPVDTHIRKVLALHYPDGFPLERYRGFAGILQQYIFFCDLNRDGK